MTERDKVIEQRLAELREWTDSAEKCDDDLAICRTIFPDSSYYWLDYEINVSFPAKSMDEIKEILKEFAKKKILIKNFRESETCPQWRLQGKNVTIRMTPNWFHDEKKVEGATCRLVKVGEEPQPPRPIYKLICEDGSTPEAVIE